MEMKLLKWNTENDKTATTVVVLEKLCNNLSRYKCLLFRIKQHEDCGIAIECCPTMYLAPISLIGLSSSKITTDDDDNNDHNQFVKQIFYANIKRYYQ